MKHSSLFPEGFLLYTHKLNLLLYNVLQYFANLKLLGLIISEIPGIKRGESPVLQDAEGFTHSLSNFEF